MGKNRQMSGGGQPTPRITSEQREQSQKIIDERWGNILSKEEREELLNSLIDANLYVSGYEPGAYSIEIQSFDPYNNDVIYMDELFIQKARDSPYYSISDIFESYKSLPAFLRNGNNPELSYEFGIGNYIDFTGSRGGQDAGWYNGRQNVVHIPAAVFDNEKNSVFSLDHILGHELGHRADYQWNYRMEDKSSVGEKPLANWEKNFSQFPVFKNLSDNQTASAYSYSFRYTKSGNISKAEKSASYYTENLAETIANTHMIHKYGNQVILEDPRSGDRTKTVTGEKWMEIRPDLADFGDKLYACKTYDEFVNLMAGDEDPYGGGYS